VQETHIQAPHTQVDIVSVTVEEEPPPITPLPVAELEIESPEEVKPMVVKVEDNDGAVKVSALSLSSIRMKRELAESQKANQKSADALPTEPFTETDMMLMWNKFAQRLSDNGQKIMATYMQMNDPVLEGTTIKLEMPNEGSKIDFDNGKHELLGYLRGKLHNHDIVIETHVNESTEKKYAFTPEEKYEKLKAINPAIELLRKTFDLDI
jgi:hypothetical protein